VIKLLALVVVCITGCVSPNISRPRPPPPQESTVDREYIPFPVEHVWEAVYYGHIDPDYDPEEE